MNGVHAPFGFQPVRKLGGGLYDGAVNKYNIASGYATTIAKGDPVTLLSDGTIGIGVAGAACVGIFMGCKYELATAESSGNTFRHSPYWPASTTVKTGTVVEAMVADDPSLVFEVQEDNGSGAAGTPLALADRNLNINFAIGTPDTAIGRSKATINNTTEATTVGLNMKLLDLAPKVGNPLGNFAVWLVTWNTHLFASGGGNTGV